MENHESQEAKLLRVLIGYFHVSVLNQLAVTEHSKPLRNLSQSDKDLIENNLIAAVANIAKQVNQDALRQILSPAPNTPPPTLH